jgi:hypothetical protein
VGLSLLNRADATVAVAMAVDCGAGAPREELLAASIRRAASLLCPTTPSDLVGSVTRVAQPLSDGDETLESEVTETLDALIGAGDLVEAIDEADGTRRRVVFLGSPRYVRRGSGDVVLLGVRPDATPLVGDELAARIDHVGHLRRVNATSDLDELLADYGLREIKVARWLRSPEAVRAEEFVRLFDDRLLGQAPSGQIPDLRVLDPTRPVGFYRGRWRPAGTGDSGRFVARRSQGYGADLWCYVEIRTGEPVRMIDLPTVSRDRGCDEAWRLQAAIDAQRGASQQIMVRGTGMGRVTLGLQAPPPRWLQRRWDLFGRPSSAMGALFAYDFASADAREELGFVIARLWLQRILAPKDEQA